MAFSLILDMLLAVLLVVTIGYAVLLNRRLGLLRADRTELEKIAVTFGEATVRAEESLSHLKHNAESLQERLAKAQSLADDLSFLVDRGSGVADRLEELVRTARKDTGIGPAPRSTVAASVASAGHGGPARPGEPDGFQPRASGESRGDTRGIEPRSEAERELLKALQSVR